MICGEPGQSLVESVPRSCTGRLYIPKVNNSTVQYNPSLSPSPVVAQSGCTYLK